MPHCQRRVAEQLADRMRAFDQEPVIVQAQRHAGGVIMGREGPTHAQRYQADVAHRDSRRRKVGFGEAGSPAMLTTCARPVRRRLTAAWLRIVTVPWPGRAPHRERRRRRSWLRRGTRTRRGFSRRAREAGALGVLHDGPDRLRQGGGSRSGTSSPVWPSTTTSVVPGAAVATTGSGTASLRARCWAGPRTGWAGRANRPRPGAAGRRRDGP